MKWLQWHRQTFLPVVIALLSGCSKLPSPPESTQNLQGLVKDANTGIYFDSTKTTRFADIPQPYREFFGHCADCHSNLADESVNSRALSKMRVSTWEEINSFGASRLLAAASFGTMPPPPNSGVPDTLINQVLTFLGSWSFGGSALNGTVFIQGRTLVSRYCGDCHTASGRNADQPRAYSLLPLDTYAQWKEYQALIRGRIAPDHPGGNQMPPAKYPLQPTLEERQILLSWIDRNSPDAINGQGVGTPDTTKPDSIVSEGAMTDVLYAPAVRIVNFYCADCHTKGGRNKDQKDAWTNADVKLDSLRGWNKARNTLIIRLDPPLAAAQRPFPFDPMPKASFPRQPTQAERDTLLTWLKLGSPNTVTGN